jgi:thiol-disulfide isomerase/thioredoxin
LASLKSVDFYRKLKRDLQSELTETSISGAALSIVATIVMFGLVVAEFNSYLTTTVESKVVLDHLESMSDDTLQVNFNLSFPHLKCEYASVDATNFMGTHDAGLAARVSKVHLDKNGRMLNKHEDRTRALQHTVDEVHEGPAMSTLLTTDNFEVAHHQHEVMIVNFFAPWCHWCQRLEPVWEKSSATLAQKYPGDSRLFLAKVDCTAPGGDVLCVQHRVDAFPTILVFRKDDTGQSDHEVYHGERSVAAITAWAEHFLAQAKNFIAKTKTVDSDMDGVADSHGGVGCMVSGLVHVQRAPGMLKIQAASESHQFNWETMDVSHTINHLSFGPFLSEKAWAVLPHNIAAAVGAMDDRGFSSERHEPTTHEHYIKVVRHEVTPPARWKAGTVVSYGYVGHSNNIQKAGEVPTVRINYDILPIVVQVREKSQALYHFITQLCAIVGGVFTVAGIVATVTDKGIQAVTKKQSLGKLG